MVVLNLSPEPTWKNKMLKFENSRCSLMQDKKYSQSNKLYANLKGRKRRFPSFLNSDKKELIPTLPVPTVPPYPIELFENNNSLCHTNRAFDCTEEFLLTHNLVNNKLNALGCDKDGKEDSKICPDIGRKLQPDLIPLSEIITKENEIKSLHNFATNSKDLAVLPEKESSLKSPTSIAPKGTFRGPSALKPFNTIGIPVYDKNPLLSATVKHTSSFKHSNQYSHKPILTTTIPWADIDRSKNWMQNFNFSQFNMINLPSVHNTAPITNGSLKTKRNSHRKTVETINKNMNNIPSRTGSSDSDNFPHGGPPPYPGLINHSVTTTTSHLQQIAPPKVHHYSPDLKYIKPKHENPPPYSYRKRPLFLPHHQNLLRQARHSHHQKTSPMKVYSESKEILISSLSPPPSLPVKPSTFNLSYGKEQRNINPHARPVDIHQPNIPIYSKVKKRKKVKESCELKQFSPYSKNFLSGGSHTIVNSDINNSNSSPTASESSASKPVNIISRNASYEDIIDFQDENDQRELNVEVCIDYSKGNKYRFWTKAMNKNKINSEAAAELHDIAPDPKRKNSAEINVKLSEINSIRSFKLGVIRVIRFGKWRFVALCCCGNTRKYAHQPGKIENYIPGFSSLADKELKNNPEADVKLEITTKDSYASPITHRFENRRMQMSNALKESGYESDSTLVFKKREDQRQKYLSPRDTSALYRQIQHGGDIPFSGLQKVAPAKPLDPVIGTVPHVSSRRHHFGEPSQADSPYKYNNSEVNIHYRAPVRTAQKEAISDEELVRRQDENMKKIYEQERRKKYLSELEDIERRRHTDNFTPQQKSPIPLNRYDDEAFSSSVGVKTPEPRQVARAMYNFAAQNKRELTLNKGDIITIRRQIDRNWYEGELMGQIGLFPANYVEVIPFDGLKRIGRRPREGQARARFNFQAQTVMELSFNKGDMVVLLRRVDDNWYEGRVGNRRGIFPVSYVDVLLEPGTDRHFSPNREPAPRPALPAAHLLYNGTSGMSSPYSTTGRTGSNMENRSYSQLTINTHHTDPIPYRALYNYKPQNEDELELVEGDVVHVMEKCDDGWFVGTSKRTGLFGTFPGNYVERC